MELGAKAAAAAEAADRKFRTLPQEKKRKNKRYNRKETAVYEIGLVFK